MRWSQQGTPVGVLAYLLAPDHGRLFKSCMYAYLPDWETREWVLRPVGKPART